MAVPVLADDILDGPPEIDGRLTARPFNDVVEGRRLGDVFDFPLEVVGKRHALLRGARLQGSMHLVGDVANLNHLAHVGILACAAHADSAQEMRVDMAADYRIIDADGHVQELDEQLAEYIGPPYAELEWHRSYPFWPGLNADGYLRSLRKPGGWAGGGTGPSAQDWLHF